MTKFECTRCNSDDLTCIHCGSSPGLCICSTDEDGRDLYCYVCNDQFEIPPVGGGEPTKKEWKPLTIPDRTPRCKHKDHESRVVCDKCRVWRDQKGDEWRSMDEAPECWCDDAASSKKKKCHTCGVKRRSKNSPWQWMDEDNYYKFKCRHYNAPVEFPDGTVVYASSRHDRTQSEPAPDFGLYLDGSWNPSCFAVLVDWKDFGLPFRWYLAVSAIIEAYRRAQDKQWVEVGCIGGHGRTGTVLACMGILSGMTPYESVVFVRETYCTSAIETEEQMWWVSWFHAFINGSQCLPKPLSDTEKKRKSEGKSVNQFQPDYTEDGPVDWKNVVLFEPQRRVPDTSNATVVHRHVYKHYLTKEQKAERELKRKAGGLKIGSASDRLVLS